MARPRFHRLYEGNPASLASVEIAATSVAYRCAKWQAGSSIATLEEGVAVIRRRSRLCCSMFKLSPYDPSLHESERCPSRKSYPRVAMMQSGQDWCGDDGPRSLYGSS